MHSTSTLFNVLLNTYSPFADKNASKHTVQLNDLFLPQVPEELSQLTQLTSLDLSNNALVTACLHLPEVLRSLKTLNLDRNRLGNMSVDAQVAMFGALERVEVLSLCANGFALLHKEAEFRSSSLRVLRLGENALPSLPASFRLLTGMLLCTTMPVYVYVYMRVRVRVRVRVRASACMCACACACAHFRRISAYFPW